MNRRWEIRLVVAATVAGAVLGAVASAGLQLLERLHVNLDRLDDVLVGPCPDCGGYGLWSALECDSEHHDR